MSVGVIYCLCITPGILVCLISIYLIYKFKQVDLGREMELHAVANQGYTSSGYYITDYNIKYSVDGNTFLDLKNGTSKLVYICNHVHFNSKQICMKFYKICLIIFILFFVFQDFSGSSSVNSVIKHSFPTPFKARFVRFVPKTYHGKPGMRVELYGCDVWNEWQCLTILYDWIKK